MNNVHLLYATWISLRMCLECGNQLLFKYTDQYWLEQQPESPTLIDVRVYDQLEEVRDLASRMSQFLKVVPSHKIILEEQDTVLLVKEEER